MDRYTKSVKIVITGRDPGLLQRNPANSMGFVKKTHTKISSTPLEEATAGLYQDKKLGIYVPSEWLHSGLIWASSGYKIPVMRKLALSPIIAGDMIIDPYKIPLIYEDWEVFTCRAVVNRQAILRSRPLFNPWSLEFQVRWCPDYLGKEFGDVGGLLYDILSKLGDIMGIGDYRGKGRFGRFEISSIIPTETQEKIVKEKKSGKKTIKK